MNLDAWQTIWVCVGLSLVVLMLDGFSANRAGRGKTELARREQRKKRTQDVIKENLQ